MYVNNKIKVIRVSSETMGNMFEPRVAFTEKGTEYKDYLQYLLYGHLAVAVSKVIILGFMFGFSDLFLCLILFCGFRQGDFCNLFIYMIYVLVSML